MAGEYGPAKVLGDDGEMRDMTPAEQQVLNGEVPTQFRIDQTPVPQAPPMELAQPRPSQTVRRSTRSGGFIGTTPLIVQAEIIDDNSVNSGQYPVYDMEITQDGSGRHSDVRLSAVEQLGKIARGEQNQHPGAWRGPQAGNPESRVQQPAAQQVRQVVESQDAYLREAVQEAKRRKPTNTGTPAADGARAGAKTTPAKPKQLKNRKPFQAAKEFIRNNKRVTAGIAGIAVFAASTWLVGFRGEVASSEQARALASPAELFKDTDADDKEDKVFSLEKLPSKIPVFTVEPTITVSTMWNFARDTEFDAKTAIGVDPGDTAFDFTASPRIEFFVSIPYAEGGENNAIAETTGENDTIRQIVIPMDKLIVEAVVYPDSIEDTTPVNFFILPADVRNSTLAQNGVSQEKINDSYAIYEANKNHAESQAIALAIKDTLIDESLREALITATKAALYEELGLRDPLEFSVTMTSPEAFALPDPVAQQYLDSNKTSSQYVRPVVSDEQKPIITTEVVSDDNQ